jgi:hypothetical protein
MLLTKSVNDVIVCHLLNVARWQATGTPGQRRAVTVSWPHRQTDLCTSALFASKLATPSFNLSYETSRPGNEPGNSRLQGECCNHFTNQVVGNAIKHGLLSG